MPSFRPKDLDYAHVRLLSICQVARQIRSGIIQLDISYQLINQKSYHTVVRQFFFTLPSPVGFFLHFLPSSSRSLPPCKLFPPFPFLLSFSPAILNSALSLSRFFHVVFSPFFLPSAILSNFRGVSATFFSWPLIILSVVLCFPPGTIDFHRRYIQWVRIRALLTAFE